MKKSSSYLKPIHLITITTLFNTSSVLVFRGFFKSGTVSFFAPILSFLLYLLTSVLLFNFLKKYPGKTIYEVVQLIFPKRISVILNGIYCLYAVYVLGRILRNTGILITTVALDKTPQILLELCILGVCIYTIWHGISVFGRLSILSFGVTFFAVIISFVMSTGNIETENLMPLSFTNINGFFSDVFSFFAVPFAENILLYNIYATSEKKNKDFKCFAMGLSIAAVTISVVSFLTIAVLGLDNLKGFYYPFYTTVSVIKNGNFFSRMEVFISASLVLNLLTKLSVCLYVAVGFLNSFNFKIKKSVNYCLVAIISIVVALLLPSTTEGIKDNLEIYSYFAPILQLGIPIVITIADIINKKSNKNVLKTE